MDSLGQKITRANELEDKLRRVLPMYEKHAVDHPDLAEEVNRIELHLYGIELLTEDQIQALLEPYETEIAEQIYEEVNTATYLIQVKIATNLQTGKIEDVWVYDSLNSCNYVDSTTVKGIGEAVVDFIRDYHRIGEVNE